MIPRVMVVNVAARILLIASGIVIIMIASGSEPRIHLHDEDIKLYLYFIGIFNIVVGFLAIVESLVFFTIHTRESECKKLSQDKKSSS